MVAGPVAEPAAAICAAIARAVTQPEDELRVNAERDLPPGYAVAVRSVKLPPG